MKRIAALIAILATLAPVPAMAMTTPVFMSNTVSNISATAERDVVITGYSGLGGASSNNITAMTMPISGTISSLCLKGFTPLTAGQYTVTLMKRATLNTAAASTTLVTTIDTSTSSSCDTTHQVAVTAGEFYVVRVDPANTPNPTLNSGLYISLAITGSTPDESAIFSVVSGTGAVPSGATCVFTPFGYIDASSATENSASSTMPTSGTIDNFYLASRVAAGATGGWNVALRINGATTTLATSLSGGSQLNNSDLTAGDAQTVSAGDHVDFSVCGTGTQSANQVLTMAVRFKPTIDGESVMFAKTSSISGAAQRFMPVAGNNNQGVEASTTAVAPVAFTWRNLYINVDTAPGGAASRSFTARIAGADSTLTTSIAGAAVSNTDVTHQPSVNAQDSISWSTTPTSAPAAPGNLRISAVAYIAPPVTNFNISTLRLNFGILKINNGILRVW